VTPQRSTAARRGWLRPLIFASCGVLFLVYWIVAPPSADASAWRSEWPNVLLFSATLLSLAVAMPAFGLMVGDRRVVRWAFVAGAGVGLSSVANILEDGFRIEAFFLAFVAGTLVLDLALLALTIVIARRLGGRSQLYALIPAGTVAGVFLFVPAGGPILFSTWLAAAAIRSAPSPA
jgi:hypothetical protein